MGYGDSYVQNVTNTLQRQGDAAANARLRQGDISAQTIGQLGQLAAQVPGQIQQAQQEAAAKAELQEAATLARQFQMPDGQPDWNKVAGVLKQKNPMSPVAAEIEKRAQAQQAATLNAQNTQSQIDTRAAELGLSQASGARADAEAKTKADAAAKAAEREASMRGILSKYADPTTGMITDWSKPIAELATAGFTTEAKQFAELAKSQQPEKVTFGAPTAGMVNGKRAFFRAGSDGKVYDMGNKEVSNVAPIQESASSGPEPLIAVMKDGKPVLVRRSLAEGMTPANNREQGRPVTSGDANRIADLDTSLSDLDVVEQAITDPGTMAKIQSLAPTWVSELTGGWSDDAKQQNAVIARVRQVIGKALEGGVLRKEDEEKYKAILPVIGDSKAVAKAKVEGLRKALIQRKQTTLDALEDASFDVSGFRNRVPDPNNGKPKMTAAELLKKYGGG
jgi:hypothetical protein